MSERITPFAPDREQNTLKEKLLALCPEIFQDGKLNVEALQGLLPDELDDDSGQTQEHFGLNWPGKTRARQLALKKPMGSALKPCPGEGVNEDTTQNIFIEGDNLEVLKLLREAYADSVKMIYIDPPYNTGNDFVYKDDFGDSLEDYIQKTGQKEGKTLLVANPKASGRFHSNWLNFIYPRLRLAREFLTETGAVFVSIDDNEVHNLKQVMNEVFGDENFVAQLVWQRSKKGDAKLIATIHEYVLVYAKNKTTTVEQGLWRRKKPGVDEVLEQYQSFKKQIGDDHRTIAQAMMKWYRDLKDGDPRKAHRHYSQSDARGLYFPDNFAGPDDGRTSRPRYDILHPLTGLPCKKPSTGWRWEESKTQEALSETPPRIHFGPDETTIPCRKSYLQDIVSEPFASVFYRDGRSATLQVEGLLGKGIFEFPKNTDVLREFLEIIGDKNAVVMDFFAGSGSTGQAVFEQNQEDNGDRKFVLVQLPELTKESSAAYQANYKSISAVSRQRLKRVGEKYPEFGFKSFALTSSTFRSFKPHIGTNTQQLTLSFQQMTDKPLVDGWTKPDLTTELMLLEGFPLHSSQTPQPQYTENEVLAIASDFTDNTLYLCLDPQLQDETVESLAIGTEDVFICLDDALTDIQKIRLDDKLKLKTV